MQKNNYTHKISSDGENISISSGEGKPEKALHSNVFNRNIAKGEHDYFNNNPEKFAQPSRNKYFANKDLRTQEDRELFTITVEIGDGENENIIIMANDTPERVAERF